MSMVPRPPQSSNTTDFVVTVFVVTVATVIVAATVTVIVASVTTSRDLSQITSSLLDIITTIIGALVGFIAGKGQGRAEVHDENAARADAAAQPPPKAEP